MNRNTTESDGNLLSRLSRGSGLAPLGRVGLNGPPGDVELGVANPGAFAQALRMNWAISPTAAGPTTTDARIQVLVDGTVINPPTVIPTGAAPGDVGEVTLPAGLEVPAGALVLVVVDPDFGGGSQVAGNLFVTASFTAL